jgi:hypothetical protein
VSRLGRWIPVATIVALLAAAMFAAVYANPRFESTPPLPIPSAQPPSQSREPTLAPTEQQLSEQGEPGRTLPSWVTYLLQAICATAVAVLVLILLWLALRDRLTARKTVPEVTDAEELRRRMQERVRAAVDEGLADLDVADADPRRAVIACWVRLEAAAAAAGTEREPGDTSTELVARLLAEHAVTAPVLQGFAAVYREARFATHFVDETMREQARAALRQVRDELTARSAP